MKNQLFWVIVYHQEIYFPYWENESLGGNHQPIKVHHQEIHFPNKESKSPGGIPPGDLFSLLGKWISWWWNLVHFQSELICWLITVISENASSRKLGNWNWFSQPLVHTVMGRNLCPVGTRPTITVWTRGWENPVPVSQLPGKDIFLARLTFGLLKPRSCNSS